MPIVEIVPGRKSSANTVENARQLYASVGRTPLVLKREVPGHIMGRIAAAVWREATQMALDGVASVPEIDKAISLGPCLGWAVQGPQLTYHLAGGSGGLQSFLAHLLTAFEAWWADLAAWTKLDPQQAANICKLVSEAYGDQEPALLQKQRDEQMMQLLAVLAPHPLSPHLVEQDGSGDGCVQRVDLSKHGDADK